MPSSEVLAIIPARGGSRGIVGKNLVPLCGKALIQYTIDAAKASNTVSRLILSSDSDQIIDYCREHGVDSPFKRPVGLAEDDTPMISVVDHVLDNLKTAEGYVPDIVVILQPTSPLRTSQHIDDAVRLLENSGADSVVSVCRVPHQYNPVSVMKIVEGRLLPFLEGEGTSKLRRHDKPMVYARNGAAVYAVRRETIVKYNNLFGKDSRALLMKDEESIDIDSVSDLKVAEVFLKEIQ